MTLIAPSPDGEERKIKAQKIRNETTIQSREGLTTHHNGEIDKFCETWPTNFSKGLLHDKFGIVENGGDFKRFIEAINRAPSKTASDFKVFNPPDAHPTDGSETMGGNKWRGWESPRCGHVYDLEGPDAGSVGMAPAPRLGSDELAAEMAEVYAMALLRDEPFEEIRSGGDITDKVVGALNNMPYFDLNKPIEDAEGEAVKQFTIRRREGRFGKNQRSLDSQSLFRGSSPGCKNGPYISQFLLVGNEGRTNTNDEGNQAYQPPVKSFSLEFVDGQEKLTLRKPKHGYIIYGAQQINQRILAHKKSKDYMTDWQSWWHVQNGANLKGTDTYEESHFRFITTPRDLATFVHFDALYQAYLNACLYLLAIESPFESGFPEGAGRHDTRDAFATFGGPHILTLVTESATRSLKAVRRQKFNHHLRARPEALGAVAALAASSDSGKLGNAEKLAKDHLSKLKEASAEGFSLLEEINQRNGNGTMANGPNINGKNYLLPMAFPEGSPMHPAYGAGHATVAGSCVTILKAFFDMFKTPDGWDRRALNNLGENSPSTVFVPNQDGRVLIESGQDQISSLTLEGELNKLAANIAIGRDMAGVHYYSDYFDSLRMGERVAVGLLLEQLLTYNEHVSMRFTSFDNDKIKLSTEWVGDELTGPKLEVNGSTDEDDIENWWQRHVAS